MRFITRAILLAAVATAVGEPRGQQLLDISAVTNDATRPVVVTLQRGLWRVLPLDVNTGGAFTAWHAWNGQNTGCGAVPGTCTQGYMWSYSIACPGMPEVKVHANLPGAGIPKFATEQEAFATSREHWFPLDATTQVSFWIGDSNHLDNLGGTSLRLELAAPTRPSFVASPASISVSAGGTQTLDLDGGPIRAGHVYLVLGSASGTSPGFPAVHWHLPLNQPDPYLGLTLGSPNSGVLVATLGVLDAQGRGRARIVLPPGQPPSIAGLRLWHAGLSLAPFGITGISDATQLDFVR